MNLAGMLILIWALLLLIFNRFFVRVHLGIQRRMVNTVECNEKEMSLRLKIGGFIFLFLGLALIVYAMLGK